MSVLQKRSILALIATIRYYKICNKEGIFSLMLKKSIKTKDLKIGMLIHIPLPWYRHPYIKNSFRIISNEQIREILGNGIYTVEVREETKIISDKKTPLAVPVKNPEPLEKPKQSYYDLNQSIIDEFHDVIADKNMAAPKKAQLVYKASVQLMTRLLESPTTENIKGFKDVTVHTVNLILSDEKTSNYLIGITAHDFNTYTHSINVGVLSILLAKSLFGKSDKYDMHELGAGFFLHDIGKTRVDSSIINKKGKFTEEEMECMRVHPKEGYNILTETNQLSEELKIIVLQHHERRDGTGYPNKLKGDGIHLYGRLCCIADVFDALTSVRPYKRAFSAFEALKIMKNEMINHFQPELFKEFVKLHQKY